MPATKRSGARRAFRRALRFLGGLMLLVLVLIAVLLAVVHTDYGRGLVRARIESELSALFVGEVRIGKLQGSLLSEFSLANVEIEDSEGDVAIALARVKVGYSLRGLFYKTVTGDTFTLDSLEVHARLSHDGVLNLAMLLKSGEPEEPDDREDSESSSPSPWRVLVPAIELRDARVTFDDGVSHSAANALMANAAFELRNGEITANVGKLTANVQPPSPLGTALLEQAALPLSAEGRLQISSDTMAVDGVRVALGRANANIPSLRLGNDGKVSAEITLDVPLEIVRVFDPTTPLLVDVHVKATAQRSDGATPVAFHMDGRAGTSPITLKGSVSPENRSAEVSLQGQSLNAQELWQGLVPSNVNLVATANAHGTTLADAVAEVKVGFSGTIDNADLGDLEIAATLNRGVAKVELAPQTGHKWIGASAEVRLDPLTIEHSSVLFDHPQIQALVGSYSDARGDLTLQASAQGPLRALILDGTASSKRFSVMGNRVRTLSASWNGTVGGGSYRGELDAKAGFVSANGTALGSVKLLVKADKPNHFDIRLTSRGQRRSHFVDAKSTVGIAPEATTIDIQRIELATKGLTWRGNSGRIVIGQDGKISFSRVALDSKAGHVGLRGDLEMQGGISSGDVEVVARDVNLRDLSAVLALKPALTGSASLKATLRKPSGKPAHGAVHLALNAIASGTEVPETSGTIALRLDHRNLTASASLDTRGVGSIEFLAKAKGPGNPMDAQAWQRLGQRALVSASIHTSALNLGALAHLAPGLPSAGTLTIDAELEDRGELGSFVAKFKDVVHPKTIEPANSKLRLALNGQEIAFSADATIGKRASATASALALLPGPLLHPATLARIDKHALQEARADATVGDLYWWDQTLNLGLEPKDSRAKLKVVVGAGIKDATVTVDATQDALDAWGKPQVRNSVLIAKLRPDSIDVKMRGMLNTAEAAAGTIHLGSGWNALLAGDPTTMANTSIAADLTVPGLPLALIVSVLAKGEVRLADLPKGSLVARALVGGTIAQPLVDAKAHTEGAAVAGIEFLSFEANASYSEHHVVAKLRGAQKAGGTLVLDSEVGLGPTPTTKTTFAANRWDLGFLQNLVPERSISGLLSADINIQGAIDEPTVAGRAHIEEGSVHPGAPLYSLRDLDVELALGPKRLTFVGNGNSGRGKLSLDGHVALKALVPTSMEINLDLDNMPLEAGPLSVRIDSRTRVRGKSKGADWRFDVDIGETLINVPGERSHTLHPDSLPGDIVFVESIHTVPPALTKALARTPASVIDVYIRARESIVVRGEPVRTVVDVDLHARVAEDLLLEGTVATRGGWLEIFGRRYDLRRADIAFGGDADPDLDIELGHEFDAMTLTIAVTGTGSEPELALRSDPARYDDAELLSFVLGASPDDDADQTQSSAGKATGAASGFVAGQLQSVVRDIVPIDVLKLELSEEDAAAEKLTLGKWITDKILLAYRRRFEAENLENANEAVIEYRFRRRWLLEFTYGDQGAGGADVLWIRRF